MVRPTALAFAFLPIVLGVLSAQEIKRVSIQPTTATSGEALFQEYCAVCHGTAGRGDGPAAAVLKKRPADLTQLSRANYGKFPADRVLRYIKGSDEVPAHGTRDMPVWGEVIRSLRPNAPDVAESRILTLERYIKSFQAQ